VRRRESNALFLVVGAAIMWFLLKQCSKTPEPIIKYIPGDSIPYTVYKGVPVPYAVHYTDTLLDTVWQDGDTEYVIQPVDTMRILKDYYAKVTYIDTVKNDSSALIVLNEVISKNRIANREVYFQNRRATAIIEERTRAVVLGFGGTLNGLDASVGYRYNRDVFNLTYSKDGVGVRYQRELGWKKAFEK
jgi:hypothetical protein